MRGRPARPKRPMGRGRPRLAEGGRELGAARGVPWRYTQPPEGASWPQAWARSVPNAGSTGVTCGPAYNSPLTMAPPPSRHHGSYMQQDRSLKGKDKAQSYQFMLRLKVQLVKIVSSE